jgi:cytochrome c biogenesis protein CcmG/thiol:disulfide interchange protein DsbE
MVLDSKEAQETITEVAEKLQQKSIRKRRIVIFTVVSIINVGLLVLLFTQLLTPRADIQSNSSGLRDVPSPLIGKIAPDFTLPALNGTAPQIRLSDLKGSAVIINFWEASCIPCNDEAPFLQSQWAKLRTQGVIMLGINGGSEKESDARQFLQKFSITYPNVKDTTDGATAITYGTTGNPETFFINRDGVVVARWLGPLDEQGLQSELSKLHLK